MKRELPGCPDNGWAMVDVRDVAAVHVTAMTAEGAAGNRFICAMVYVVRPSRALGSFFLEKVLAPIFG